jgi:hypothetical protein
MKKGKKMPSIELEGHSEAKFVLVDGKIMRAERAPSVSPPAAPQFTIERLRE